MIAWFVILFTGQAPAGTVQPNAQSHSAYLRRAGGYFLLLTEDWPPFSYEEGGAAPGRRDQQRSRKPQGVT